MTKRIALLIDAENITSKIINPILPKIKKYDDLVIRRAYGD